MKPILTVTANGYQEYISDDRLFKVAIFEWRDNLHVSHSLYTGCGTWTNSASTSFPLDSDREKILEDYEQLYLSKELPDSHLQPEWLYE